MPKVVFTTQHTVEMDELNKTDIKNMANEIAKGGKLNVESVVQDIEITSVRASYNEDFDCKEDEIGELQA